MKQTKLVASIMAFFMALATVTSCTQTGENSTADSANPADTLPELKGDDGLNRAARFYAGVSREGVDMLSADAQEWEKYSKDMKKLTNISFKTLGQVDSLAKADFSDFRDSVDLVFYPFSAADFLYPITLFPNADTYLLCGLEKTGTPFSTDIKTNYDQYEAYHKALSTFLRISFFVTKNMKNDMDNELIDGTCPIITMLMATAGYDIISIENLQIDDDGNLLPGDGKGTVMKYKFFRQGSKHEQTLYYVSADVANSRIDPRVKRYVEKSLPNHTVGTYLKAASYLMHMPGFSLFRDYIVDYSQYIVEDDSGVPYKYLTDKYDITLYGVYKRPLMVFSDSCIQPDLDKAYKAHAGEVKRLPFLIGYNSPSNWLCARRIQGK